MMGLKLIPLIIILFGSMTLLSKPVTNDQKKLYIDEQIRFADGLIHRGHFTLAIDEYKRLINQFPNSELVGEAWLQLAEAYSIKKDYTQSFAIFQTFLKKFPNIRITSAAKLRYALTLNKTTKENKAKAFLLLKNLKENKNIPEVIKEAAIYNLGMIYLKSGKQKKAEEEFALIATKKALTEADNFKVYSAIELAKLRPTNAIKLLMPITQSSSMPLEILNDVIWQVANILFQNNNYKQAEIMFAKYALLFPNTRMGREAQYKRLECLYIQKDYTSTLSETDKQLAINKRDKRGTDIKIYYLKALALKQLKFYDRAITILKFILDNTKKAKIRPLASYAYIDCLIADNKRKEADDLINNYIQQNKLPKETIKDIVLLLISSSNNDPKYKELIQKALKLMKPDSHAATELKFQLSILLEKNNQPEKAKELYKEIAENGTPNIRPYALMRLADIYEAQHNKSKTLSIYKQVLKDFPSTPIYSDALLKTSILLLEDRDNWNTAKIYLNNLISKFPNSKPAKFALFYQAFILFNENKLQEANKKLDLLLTEKNISNNLKNDALIYKSWLLLKNGKIQSAIKLINTNQKQLLLTSPKQFLLDLGAALLKENPTFAKKCFEIVTTSNDNLEKQKGYLKLSEANIELGDLVLAIEALKSANKLKLKNLLSQKIKIKLANLLIKRKQNSEALLLFEECLDNPIDKKVSAKARLGLATILSEDKNRLKTANRYAMSVFILSKDDDVCSTAMLLSIKISLKQGNINEAKSTWKEFEARFPDLSKKDKGKKIKEQILEIKQHNDQDI